MTVYSAVVTTGIYCRPGCGARPRADNVRTFDSAAAAEAAGFRACLRCRPYRLAGSVPWREPELICRAVRLIIDGVLDMGTEEALGRRLGLSARHLRRLFHAHLGLTPDQLARSRRTHFARRLLDDTDLSVADVAFASGFGSIRQFNRAMRETFRASPQELRGRRRRADRLVIDGGLGLRLPFDGPYDWGWMLDFLAARAIVGVEAVSGDTYRRVITVDGGAGVLEVRPGGPDHLVLQAHLPYWEGLIHVVERTRHLLGLDFDLAAAVDQLGRDPTIGPLIAKRPGLRPPGSWAPFEAAMATVTESARLGALVREHGEPVPGLPHGLTHAFPGPHALATVHPLARAVVDGSVVLDGSVGLDALVAALTAVPGIDTGTAHHIALRVGEPDAGPEATEAWRPWRALASVHLKSAGTRSAARLHS